MCEKSVKDEECAEEIWRAKANDRQRLCRLQPGNSLRGEGLHPEQQVPNPPPIKEEAASELPDVQEHEEEICKFPLPGVTVKSEEANGDHRGGPQAEGLLAPLSESDDITSHSSDNDADEHSTAPSAVSRAPGARQNEDDAGVAASGEVTADGSGNRPRRRPAGRRPVRRRAGRRRENAPFLDIQRDGFEMLEQELCTLNKHLRSLQSFQSGVLPLLTSIDGTLQQIANAAEQLAPRPSPVRPRRSLQRRRGQVVESGKAGGGSSGTNC
ncbi:uncharacterized protein LOC133497652 [Syngnathoides biaculeatus]|uniref:uncharacterized protein LOC133497652 n=1 Tax=Syngnathoides biaculeatus TaxID=300417 RepID=UPI002ADDBDCB|nr:uncharacterized protein LOC133497652 [Syngnathoides biaculeatus]